MQIAVLKGEEKVQFNNLIIVPLMISEEMILSSLLQ